MKQPDPQLGFKGSDLAADGGFRQAQPARSFGEGLCLCDCDKGLEGCKSVHCCQSKNSIVRTMVIVLLRAASPYTRRTGPVPAFKSEEQPHVARRNVFRQAARSRLRFDREG